MAIIFAILTIFFLMGKGSSLIAINTITSKEEKQKYYKLSQIIGIFLGIIDVLLIIISIISNNLPKWFDYIFIKIIIISIIAITFLSCIDILFRKSENIYIDNIDKN